MNPYRQNHCRIHTRREKNIRYEILGFFVLPLVAEKSKAKRENLKFQRMKHDFF